MYTIKQLISVEQLQRLLESHYRLTGIACGLEDNNGHIVVAAGLQEIYTRFHWTDPASFARCWRNDPDIKAELESFAGDLFECRCKNGMINVAMPIVVDGNRIAIFFVGQFFYEDDTPDIDRFQQQTDKFEFEPAQHCNSLRQIPVFSKSHVQNTTYFLHQLVQTLVDTGFETFKHIYEIEGHKQTEQQIGLLSHALDLVREAAILVDSHKRLKYVNQEACRSLGYSRQELLGMTISGINPDYTPERAITIIDKLLKHGSLTFETHRQTKGGRIFPVEVSSSLFVHGGHRYVLTLARDITERKQAEEVLRESEERFRNMFEKHNAVMLLVEPKSGVILAANRSAEIFYGYPPERLKQMLISEINMLPPENIARECENAALEKRNFFVFPHRLENGETRIVEVHSSPISIQGQSTLFSIIHDVTERKRMEEALVAREQEFRSLAENSPDNIVRYDREGYALYVNPSLEKTLGMSARDIIGKKIIGPQVTERTPGYRDMLQKVITTGINAEMEMRFPDGNGDFLHHQIKFVTERNHEGAMTGVLAIGRDITVLKQAEQALLDKQQRLSSMTDELCLAEERERRRIATELHDNIGQDLVLAQIKLGMLAKSSFTDAEAGLLGKTREILGTIIQRVRFLTHIISPPILESDGLESALKWLARQMETDYCLQIIFVDDMSKKNLSKEMQSVLYHATRELLINIAKHAECSTGKVAVGRDDNNIVIRVEDDGIGFDSTAIEKKGSGFGLINVRRKICHLGGTFEVKSSPGTGTHVTVTMPLSKEPGNV